jgi:hydroxymethylpyrimidine pyrophosphatase-like HAD family hydrolase
MERRRTAMRDGLILVCGIALLLLVYDRFFPNVQPLPKALESVGLAMVVYAPIQLFIILTTRLSERHTEKGIDRAFAAQIRITLPKKKLPLFIATDIEGCLTPPDRTEINLRKFQKMRAYCEFVNRHPEYPQIVLFTGRSQGYVELLAQSLGMLRTPLDIPFVIENGAALYYPNARKTKALATRDQQEKINKALPLLAEKLPENKFEPKSHMITINPTTGQTIDNLRDLVTSLLHDSDLTILSTASAIDITPPNITKLSGLKEVIASTYNDDKAIKNIVAIVDHISDLDVIKAAGSAYCPEKRVHGEVRSCVEARFGEDHIIDLPDIDFVLHVIERECGVRVL